MLRSKYRGKYDIVIAPGPKEIKEAYIEGWIDRDYSSGDDVGLVSVAIEKDWVKSNSSVSIISIERK